MQLFQINYCEERLSFLLKDQRNEVPQLQEEVDGVQCGTLFLDQGAINSINSRKQLEKNVRNKTGKIALDKSLE